MISQQGALMEKGIGWKDANPFTHHFDNRPVNHMDKACVGEQVS